MANTRCANPEYQLDVDTLVIEYVAYKAIEAQLKVLQVSSATQQLLANGAHAATMTSRQDAIRLTEIYDSHFREIFRLDTYLLQFLVLLNLWLQNQWETTTGQRPQLAPQMQQSLQRDQFINQSFRHLWLNNRERKSHAEMVGLVALPSRRDSPLCLAHHLLPRFMHLSYQMRSQDAEPSGLWMNLAASFMLHAAIETLYGPNALTSGSSVIDVAVRECFAWGYIDRPRFENNQQIVQQLVAQILENTGEVSEASIAEFGDHIQKSALLEDRVWDMLYDEGTADRNDDTGPTLGSSGEISEWTHIRQKNLEIALSTLAAMQDETESNRQRPVEWLRNQHRLSDFLSELTKFLMLYWTELHSSEREGKPILVQIEEGGIDGLSAEEFDTFTDRARIDNAQWFEIMTNL